MEKFLHHFRELQNFVGLLAIHITETFSVPNSRKVKDSNLHFPTSLEL